MAKGYLKVTIKHDDKELDLRFSCLLSLRELKKLIEENGLVQQLDLAAKHWHLEPVYKQLRMEQHRPLAEYPLGNGDVLGVVVDG
ncbi:hypothetical protein ACVRXQ_03635 [Streptococcus panodentis]|uniref:Ubiquitin-like domain-containing protein n=1 Tax=Streptococcus panodentis TaxID=1581472 RepID=A0ABS5AZ45_9STRE|nr:MULTISPECIES: hypothetical protein [Streptococcus]KXT85439.1 hypothetical protein STRDD11_00375 [Streptococcus sp. DD11]MBP2621849.1 hypothetical protein [Streptococcus panodentis]